MTSGPEFDEVLIVRRVISAPRERRTEVVLTHRGLPRRTFDAHKDGWGAIVRTLATLLE